MLQQDKEQRDRVKNNLPLPLVLSLLIVGNWPGLKVASDFLLFTWALKVALGLIGVSELLEVLFEMF